MASETSEGATPHEEATSAPAAPAVPAADPAPAVQPPGGQQLRARGGVTPSIADVPEVVVRNLHAAGKPSAAESYGAFGRRFVRWIADRQIDPATMPPDTADTFLAQAFASPITRNIAATAIRGFMTTAEQMGVRITSQVVSRVATPKKSRNTRSEPMADSSGAPFPPAPTLGGPPPPIAPDPTPRPSTSAQPAQTQSAAQPRRSVGFPTSASAVPSLGGRIRIAKRIDGSEGVPGGVIGRRVLVGDYQQSDLEGEGSIEQFIASYIRPNFGPHPGGRPATYYVDRLDAQGNPIQGATVEVPIMPEIQPPAERSAQKAASNGNGGDHGDATAHVVESLLKKYDDATKKYETLVERFAERAQQSGTDPTLVAMLMQQARPPPLDVNAIVAEVRRATQPQSQSGSLDGLFNAATPVVPPVVDRSPDPAVQVLGELVRDLSNRLNDVMIRLSAPPAAQAAQPDPMDTFTRMLEMTKLLQPAPVVPQSDPLRDKLVEAALGNLLHPPVPEKGKGITDLIAEWRALKEARDVIGEATGAGGSGGSPSLTDLLAIVIENAGTIGDAVAKVASVAQPKAPQIPAHQQRVAQQLAQSRARVQASAQRAAPAVSAALSGAGRPPAAARGPQSQQPQPVMPQAAQEAFRVLKAIDPADEQGITDSLFSLLGALASGPAPFPLLATRVRDTFISSDTKPELRSLVTQLYKWCGALRNFGSEAVIEKITNVIHRNYSLIYTQLAAGQEKTLADAVPREPGSPVAPSDTAHATDVMESARLRTVPDTAEAGDEEEEEEGEEEEGDEDEEGDDDTDEEDAEAAVTPLS